MLSLLLLILSYGSLLILLMPATWLGILITVAIFAVGTVFDFYKKLHCHFLSAPVRYAILPAAAFIAIALSVVFYERWLPSSMVRAIAAAAHMSVGIFLVAAAVVLAVLSFWCIYRILQSVIGLLDAVFPKKTFLRSLLLIFLAAVCTVVLTQGMLNKTALSMGLLRCMWCTVIAGTVIVLFFILTGRIVLSAAVGGGLFLLISTVSAYVYKFRGRLFEPLDIFSAGTAMNVAGNYSLLPIPVGVVTGWCFFVVVLVLLACLFNKGRVRLPAKRRLVLLGLCALSCAATFIYVSGLKTHHWHDNGAQYYGCILDFVSKFKEITVSKPDGYSAELIDELAGQYMQTDTPQETEKTPHIIVIMDESFSDLGVNGTVSTDIEATPFISALMEKTVSGYAFASIYGGNTANSEYEFLTGNSLAWLSPNAVPYQQYIRTPTYSMVSYLKAGYGYRCIAMHPFYANGWERPAVYTLLGFDESHFIDDFPQQKLVRDYVSDLEMFEYLVETYEAQKSEPLFIFGVTMQNHGGYTYEGENYTASVSLTEYDEFPEVEQYLSLLHETDKTVEYLISYFENVEDDVVIVFFGDHQPSIKEEFYDALGAASTDTLDV